MKQRNEAKIGMNRALPIKDLLEFFPEDEVREQLLRFYGEDKADFVEKLIRRAKEFMTADRNTVFNESAAQSHLPYAVTLLPLLYDKNKSMEYLKFLANKFDRDFARKVLSQATEYKKGAGAVHEDAIGTVTGKNPDGTVSVAVKKPGTNNTAISLNVKPNTSNTSNSNNMPSLTKGPDGKLKLSTSLTVNSNDIQPGKSINIGNLQPGDSELGKILKSAGL